MNHENIMDRLTWAPCDYTLSKAEARLLIDAGMFCFKCAIPDTLYELQTCNGSLPSETLKKTIVTLNRLTNITDQLDVTIANFMNSPAGGNHIDLEAFGLPDLILNHLDSIIKDYKKKDKTHMEPYQLVNTHRANMYKIILSLQKQAGIDGSKVLT